MKVLCIKQPWVNHILSGEKTIEIRSYNTNFRGKLLIACSKSPKSELGGYVVAEAEIINSRPTKPSDSDKSLVPYKMNNYSWELSGIRKIVPLPVKGQLGLFDSGYAENDLVYKENQ